MLRLVWQTNQSNTTFRRLKNKTFSSPVQAGAMAPGILRAVQLPLSDAVHGGSDVAIKVALISSFIQIDSERAILVAHCSLQLTMTKWHPQALLGTRQQRSPRDMLGCPSCFCTLPDLLPPRTLPFGPAGPRLLLGALPTALQALSVFAFPVASWFLPTTLLQYRLCEDSYRCRELCENSESANLDFRLRCATNSKTAPSYNKPRTSQA